MYISLPGRVKYSAYSIDLNKVIFPENVYSDTEIHPPTKKKKKFQHDIKVRSNDSFQIQKSGPA